MSSNDICQNALYICHNVSAERIHAVLHSLGSLFDKSLDVSFRKFTVVITMNMYGYLPCNVFYFYRFMKSSALKLIHLRAFDPA